jgi:predicted DNA-binding transcriptional regulator YafY
MSKQIYISRYLLIIKKIKTEKYCSFPEIEQFLEQQAGRFFEDGLDLSLSKRTFQRDIREIATLFCIDIEYSKARDAYFISNEPDNESYFMQLASYSDFLNTIQYAKEVSPYIAFERKEDNASQYVALILKAIHLRKRISFTYHKFKNSDVSLRKLDTYGLKEHRGRWYVVGRDSKDNLIKSFGLDRIEKLMLHDEFYNYPSYFSMSEYFKYSFGIIRPTDQEPDEIIIECDALKGQYIKTYPLHHTQQIISETSISVTLKLYLYITFDLMMELRSHGNEIRIIQPTSLIEQL